MSKSLQTWMYEAEKYTKNLKEKIDEIKSISDLKKQDSEIYSAKIRFGLWGELGNLIKTKPNNAHSSLYLEECKELFKELEDLDGEISKKLNQERKKNNKKTDTFSKKQKKFTCDECGDTKKGEYKYHKSKKDNQKFCSDNCFFQHYAETCDNCLEKCLKYSGSKAVGSADTYYSDPQNKNGILCSKCHQEQIKELSEEKRKDKDWEESFKRIDKAIEGLVDGLEEVVDRNQDNSEDREDDNQESRIKNQESRIKNQESRIKNQIQYFSTNSISSVELTAEGDLDIKYDKGGQKTVKDEGISPELQKIKVELEKNGTKKLTKEELEKELQRLEAERKELEQGEKEPKHSSLGLKIGIGALAGAFLVGLIAIIIKNKKNKKI